jgi:hypothetical protein
MTQTHSDDLVVVRTFSYRHEAELGRSMLEGHGVDAIVSADDCGGLRPAVGVMAGVRLLVRRSDEKKAGKLLGNT